MAARIKKWDPVRKDKVQRAKTIVAVILLILLIWGLAPSRSPKKQDGAKVVEITFMGPTGPLVGSMADMVRAFEQESRRNHEQDPSRPILRVISGQSGSRDQTGDPTRFLTSVAGGMPPDVIQFDRFAVAEWAARGAFIPLDDLIQKDLDDNHPDAIQAERYYKPIWDESVYNGTTWCIPCDTDNRVLFYNKDSFRRAGLVDEKGIPTPPRDWDELRDFANRLTVRDNKGRLKSLGFSPNYGNSWFYMYSWMNGGEFLSPDGLKIIMNHPLNVEALHYMVDVYNDLGGYKEVMAFQAGFQGGALDPFIIGKLAMRIDVSGLISLIAQFGKDLDFGVAACPTSPRMVQSGTPAVSWSGGWAYAIPVTALHKKEAWEFIRFALSERAFAVRLESDREAVEAQGKYFIPLMNPRQDLNEKFMERYVFSHPRIPKRIKEGMRVAMDMLPISKFRPVTPVGQLLWQWHVNAMEDACYGRKTPEAALTYATGVVQRDLDRILHPIPGEPISDWSFFLVVYIILILSVGLLVYWWDTRLGFRRFFTRLFRRHHIVDHGDVIEGSQGGFFRSQWRAGFLFASPWIIGFILFGGGPLLFSILISFCDYDVIQPAKFTGFANYRMMFTEDDLVPIAFANTFYMILGIPLGLVVSLSLALLLNMAIRGINVWRTLFYLPAIVPAVASFILWIWIFNPQGGVLNGALRLVGIEGPLWLQDANWSKPALIIMGLWGAGGGMLIWLAGLKGISEQYYEAAAIDGASLWQEFIHITLPMLTPYIFFHLVMGMIGVFQIFDAAFVMTYGGPANSTLFYVYHLFNNAFRYGHMGYASAMAWILFIIILLFTLLQFWTGRKWVHYESE